MIRDLDAAPLAAERSADGVNGPGMAAELAVGASLARRTDGLLGSDSCSIATSLVRPVRTPPGTGGAGSARVTTAWE